MAIISESAQFNLVFWQAVTCEKWYKKIATLDHFTRWLINFKVDLKRLLPGLVNSISIVA